MGHRKPLRNSRIAIAAMLALWVTACGGDGTGGSGQAAMTFVPVRALISGGDTLLPVVGATVRIRSADGDQVLGSDVTRSRGVSFADLVAKALPQDFLVEVSGGYVDGVPFADSLCAEVRDYPGASGPRTVAIDPVTTLERQYHQVHPELSVADVAARVRTLLALPTWHTHARHRRSDVFFDGRAYLAAATSNGGIAAFNAILIGEIDAGNRHPFNQLGGTEVSSSLLLRPLPEHSAGTAPFLPALTGGAAGGELEPLPSGTLAAGTVSNDSGVTAAVKAGEGGAFAGLGSNLLRGLLSGAGSALANLALDYITAALGFPDTSDVIASQLAAIDDQLHQLDAALTNLEAGQQALLTLSTEAQYNELVADAVDLVSEIDSIDLDLSTIFAKGAEIVCGDYGSTPTTTECSTPGAIGAATVVCAGVNAVTAEECDPVNADPSAYSALVVDCCQYQALVTGQGGFVDQMERTTSPSLASPSTAGILAEALGGGAAGGGPGSAGILQAASLLSANGVRFYTQSNSRLVQAVFDYYYLRYLRLEIQLAAYLAATHTPSVNVKEQLSNFDPYHPALLALRPALPPDTFIDTSTYLMWPTNLAATLVWNQYAEYQGGNLRFDRDNLYPGDGTILWNAMKRGHENNTVPVDANGSFFPDWRLAGAAQLGALFGGAPPSTGKGEAGTWLSSPAQAGVDPNIFGGTVVGQNIYSNYSGAAPDGCWGDGYYCGWGADRGVPCLSLFITGCSVQDGRFPCSAPALANGTSNGLWDLFNGRDMRDAGQYENVCSSETTPLLSEYYNWSHDYQACVGVNFLHSCTEYGTYAGIFRPDLGLMMDAEARQPGADYEYAPVATWLYRIPGPTECYYWSLTAPTPLPGATPPANGCAQNPYPRYTPTPAPTVPAPPATSPPTATPPMPGGSWSLSCAVPTWDGTTLCASCDLFAGGTGNSCISNCINVENQGTTDFGFSPLVCTGPPGTWRATYCRHDTGISWDGTTFCAECLQREPPPPPFSPAPYISSCLSGCAAYGANDSGQLHCE